MEKTMGNHDKIRKVPKSSLIDDLYRSGASHKAIAEATGLALSSVSPLISRRIKKGLLEMRSGHGRPPIRRAQADEIKRPSEPIADQVNEAARLAMLGLTNFEIMTKMSLTMIQVQLRIAAARKLGLVPKGRRSVCMACFKPGHNRRTCSNISR